MSIPSSTASSSTAEAPCPPTSSARVQEFIEANEFNLALETLCGFMIDRNRRVPRELYFRIHSLCERLDGVDPYLLECVKAIVVSPD